MEEAEGEEVASWRTPQESGRSHGGVKMPWSQELFFLQSRGDPLCPGKRQRLESRRNGQELGSEGKRDASETGPIEGDTGVMLRRNEFL